MNGKDSKNQFRLALDANRPVIYVSTMDIPDTIEQIRDVCHRHSPYLLNEWDLVRGLRRWDALSGLHKEIPNNQLHLTPGQYVDPTRAISVPLAFVPVDEERNNIQVWLYSGVAHRFVRNDGQLDIVAHLHTLAEVLPTRQPSGRVVIVGPYITLPDDLKRVVYTIDWELPSVERLERVVSGKCAAIKDALDSATMRTIATSLRGLTMFQAGAALNQAYMLWGHIDATDEVLRSLLDEKKQVIRSILGGGATYIEPTTTLADVGGLGNVKKYLYLQAKALEPEAEDRNVRIARGMVVAGPPGTGKSLVSKAAISALRLPGIVVNYGELFGELVGQTEGNVRALITLAKSLAPCILVFEEIDNAMVDPTERSGDSGTARRSQGILLQAMEEELYPAGVFCIATLNWLTNFDPALLRRFGSTALYFVDFPNERARAEIFHIHLERRGHGGALSVEDINLLARVTDHFSGAEIEAAIELALQHAYADEGPDFTLLVHHITNAAAQVKTVFATQRDKIELMRDACSIMTPADVSGGPLLGELFGGREIVVGE